MSKALILAGRLKPDARLGLELSEFATALDEENRKTFVNMRSRCDKGYRGVKQRRG